MHGTIKNIVCCLQFKKKKKNLHVWLEVSVEMPKDVQTRKDEYQQFC